MSQRILGKVNLAHCAPITCDDRHKPQMNLIPVTRAVTISFTFGWQSVAEWRGLHTAR